MTAQKNSATTITGFVGEFLSGLAAREREVLAARYGLSGGEGLTLQAIGDKYGITRERVRQIEASGLQALRKNLNHPYFKGFVEAATSHLNKLGGVQKEDAFFSDLAKTFGHRGSLADFSNHTRFILELSGKVSSYRDSYNNIWHPYWYVGEADRKKSQAFVAKLESAAKSKKIEILGGNGNGFNAVFISTAKALKLPEIVGKSYLETSKKFGTSPFGEFGLVSWAEVRPRTARDWAYLILKKEKKPLHFTELAQEIGGQRKDKKTNLQTVHNELIKDDRFVLVGRGMYGLREHGLIPGTAREIIAHLLKKHGPMSSKDVVGFVKEQRFFKEGTILINLQNRKHFTCMPDGRYCLREA